MPRKTFCARAKPAWSTTKQPFLRRNMPKKTKRNAYYAKKVEKKVRDNSGSANCKNTNAALTTFTSYGWVPSVYVDGPFNSVNFLHQDLLEINSSGPNTRLLTGIKQGNTNMERIGNAISVRALRLRISMSAASRRMTTGEFTDPEGPGDQVEVPGFGKFCRTTIRVVVVQDLQCSSTSSAQSECKWSDVFNSTNASGGITIFTTQDLNPNTLGRYKILKDRNFVLDMDDPQQHVVMNIANHYKNIRFMGTDYNSIQKNPIFILYCASVNLPPFQSSVDAANTGDFLPPTITWNSRVIFTDE